MTKSTTKNKYEYTVDIYFDSRDGNKPVSWDSISQDEKRKILNKMSANLSSSMSRYYQTNPEEFANFQ